MDSGGFCASDRLPPCRFESMGAESFRMISTTRITPLRRMGDIPVARGYFERSGQRGQAETRNPKRVKSRRKAGAHEYAGPRCTFRPDPVRATLEILVPPRPTLTSTQPRPQTPMRCSKSRYELTCSGLTLSKYPSAPTRRRYHVAPRGRRAMAAAFRVRHRPDPPFSSVWHPAWASLWAAP
jgi:hypothetical protein